MAHSDSHHAPAPPFQDDRSSDDPHADPTLTDYVAVLVRRRRLIAAIIAAGLAAGIIHALLATRTYTVQTVIEIGRVGGDKLIDPPETILAKLSHAYIPDVLQANRTEHPEGPGVTIGAKIPKSSEVVVLESRATKQDGATHRSLHEAVAQRLIRDHQRTADQIVKQYESELSRATLKLDELSDPRVFIVQEKLLQGEIERGRLHLAALKDQAKLIETESKRFDETKKLLAQQVAEIRGDLASATDHRTRSAPEATDGARAMALLMIDSQIVDGRSRLGTLEERLYITLENDREKLLKQMADIRRDQETQSAAIGELGSKLIKLRVDREREKTLQQQTITDIETKLAGVRTTGVLSPPAQSLEAAGTGKKAILAVYGLLGLIGGIVAAFFTEFVATTRAHLRASGEGSAAVGDAEAARRPSRSRSEEGAARREQFVDPLRGGGFSIDPHDRLGARGPDDHPAPVAEVELEDALDLGPPRDRETSDRR